MKSRKTSDSIFIPVIYLRQPAFPELVSVRLSNLHTYVCVFRMDPPLNCKSCSVRQFDSPFFWLKLPHQSQRAVPSAWVFYLKLAFQMDQHRLCDCLKHCSHLRTINTAGCHRNRPSSQPAVLSRCSSSSFLTSLHPHHRFHIGNTED